MKFKPPENIPISEALKVFKSAYKEEDFFTPSQVPKIIQILENPSYSFKFLGIEICPGRTTLEQHDYIHAIFGVEETLAGEALIIGATMGSTGKMNIMKAFLFVWAEYLFMSKEIKITYKDFKVRKIFYTAVKEATILAKNGELKDLSKINYNDHLSDSIGTMQKRLGIDILIKKFQTT